MPTNRRVHSKLTQWNLVEEHRNSKDILQHLEEPSINTSRSLHHLTQTPLNSIASNSQDTQIMYSINAQNVTTRIVLTIHKEAANSRIRLVRYSLSQAE